MTFANAPAELDGLIAYPAAFLLGLAVWAISTVAGGGGPPLFIPAAGLLAPLREVAPMTSVTAGLVSVHRTVLFRRFVDWGALAWLAPGSLVGAVCGVRLFAALDERWLGACLAVFLLYHSACAFRREGSRSFVVRPWHLATAGGLLAGTSAVLGASGQGVNVLLLNRGLTKERLIATKAVNSALVQGVKVAGYLHFAAIGPHVLRLGLTAACGAMLGNLVGRRVLSSMSERGFRRAAEAVTCLSGVLMAYSVLTGS